MLPDTAEGKNKYVVGWDAQQPMLARLSRGRLWQRRKPQITWRGRHGPGRDQLRCPFWRPSQKFRLCGNVQTEAMQITAEWRLPGKTQLLSTAGLHSVQGAVAERRSVGHLVASDALAANPKPIDILRTYMNALQAGLHPVPGAAAE